MDTRFGPAGVLGSWREWCLSVAGRGRPAYFAPSPRLRRVWPGPRGGEKGLAPLLRTWITYAYVSFARTVWRMPPLR